MTFKFQITDAVEIFKDPIGHYHHWTVLVGRLVEGTMHLGDRICIPAVDGTKMGARVGGFEAYGLRFGSEVSSRQHTDPFGVMVSSPAPGQGEIAMGAATSSSSREFHELAAWTLQHRPSRLLHDRGPDGRGFPCQECTRGLFSEGPVLHADFAPILQGLHHNPNPYIASLAWNIIRNAMSAEEYKQRVRLELQELARLKVFRWRFWKRK